ncbi:hypothetical protein Golomagni_04236 [Golovinomyces magnicellulatus]|nr:hypothetical protein Golomagni_04236 [Golovinomyces magnicellulatus]
MAKRMQFSVVGLPHYTIWHMYEPSVDDVRYMKELEQERKAHEKLEEEKALRLKKIKETFADPNSQWEKDKMDIQDLAKQEKEKTNKQLEGKSPEPIQKDINKPDALK